MIFLDTCVWIELLGVRTPEKPHEIRQAEAASSLLSELLTQKKTIVTCKEQMVELINAIEKVSMRSVNKSKKESHLSGVSNIKEFRRLPEFQCTKELCESVISDLLHFAKIKDIGEYDITSILRRLDVADINDCLYYDYCIRENINFYTFDSDIVALGENPVLHKM